MSEEVWRHKKRGTLYRRIGTAHIQTAEPLHDLEEVIVYADVKSGRLWARPLREFYDGRFEEIALLSSPAPAKDNERQRGKARHAARLTDFAHSKAGFTRPTLEDDGGAD